MFPFSSEESTRIEIRGQKILIAALAIGQLFFAAIALVVQRNREETKSFTHHGRAPLGSGGGRMLADDPVRSVPHL
jgi:hypothetical protein